MSGVWTLLVFVAVWFLLFAWKAAGDGKPSEFTSEAGVSGDALEAGSDSGCHSGGDGDCQ